MNTKTENDGHPAPGERVTMTQAAIDAGLDGRKRRAVGTVVAMRNAADHPGQIMVLRDGLKQPERWHNSFWKALES